MAEANTAVRIGLAIKFQINGFAFIAPIAAEVAIAPRTGTLDDAEATGAQIRFFDGIFGSRNGDHGGGGVQQQHAERRPHRPSNAS
jgi:hypothetical protein